MGRGIALPFHDHGTKRGEWSAARPSRTLPPGKTRYPLYRRMGGPQDRFGRAENLAPPGFDPRTVQPAVSRYTDWATRPTDINSGVVFFSWGGGAPGASDQKVRPWQWRRTLKLSQFLCWILLSNFKIRRAQKIDFLFKIFFLPPFWTLLSGAAAPLDISYLCPSI